ncbi:MAG: hypothetical protein AAFP84_08830 [Actinomycetota bacterium]
MPRGLWRRLPSVFWTRITHLGVIESTRSSRVAIDSRVGRSVPPVDYLGQRLLHHPRRGEASEQVAAGPESESRFVDVGGESIRFDGVVMGSLWLGAGCVGDVAVEVLTEGVSAGQLALREITDPAPYLARQRRTPLQPGR